MRQYLDLMRHVLEHGARKNGLVGMENAVAELEAEFATARTALSALL